MGKYERKDNMSKKKDTKTNYTYILQCADGSYYTGWTNDIAARLSAHRSGKGARYTSAHLPVTLVYYEVYETKQEAMKREAAIKKLKRKEKIELVASLQEESIKEQIKRLNAMS